MNLDFLSPNLSTQMELAIYKEPNSIVKSYEQSFDQTTDKANQSGQCLQEDRTHQVINI